MAGNKALAKANKAKNDEFYTQLSDIERELKHYKGHFRDKVIFCNCDDPETSNFWRYFELNFTHLGLKKLIATHYETKKTSYKLELVRDVNGDGNIDRLDIIKTDLKQNGDFRSPECVDLLKEADIVVTNPPFSLFREYVGQLMDYEKKFLIIGGQNAITYKEVFKYIKTNEIWLGIDNGGTKWFRVPDHYNINTESRIKIEDGIKYFSMGSIMWFTNLDHTKRHEDLILYKTYNEKDYPTYDNYDAINVDKTKDIPCDYYGPIGVPITFLDKYNPDQFEILGLTSGRNEFEAVPTKRYVNPLQINKNKTVSNGSKANTRATILLTQTPEDIYYTADNADGPLKILYARLIVRRKGGSL
ncbi:modification methylase [Candidatus Nomurabacteria bacterium]|nr:modification methylase [Candidatus Nomurabacteria bacterium]